MKNYKRFLAVSLAATMVMGSSVTVFAADEGGSTSGSGSLDIVEATDIFQVELPTVPENDTTFNYILDPTGVIAETDAAKYEGKKFVPDKTLYFQNTGDNQVTDSVDGTDVTYDYSDSSNKLTATNKSTMDVDIKVKATISAVKGITMASSSTFAEDKTEPMLYLALKDDDDGNSDTAVTADGVEVSSKIAKLDGAYETKYENGKYVKKLKADATGFKSYSFQLTGACNPKGDWGSLKDTPPEVEVVWSVKNPIVTGPQVTLSEAGLITLSGLTADANIVDAGKDLTLGINDEMYPINTTAATWITDDWDEEEGGVLKAQLLADYAAFNDKEVKVSVKLSDGSTVTCSTVVKIATE